MKVGLFGYPNSGKKTLFELLTGEELNGKRSNNPNEAIPGIVKIRDQRIDKLASIYSPHKVTPMVIEFVLTPDILKNTEHSDKNMLEPIFQSMEHSDVISFVIREFQDESIFHLDGSINPKRDITNLNNELIIRDLIFTEKRIERLQKDLRVKQLAEKIKEKELMERMQEHLEAEKPLRSFVFSTEELKTLNSYPLLTRKPTLIILNIDESKLQDKSTLNDLQSHFADQDFSWLQLSAQIENELEQLDSKEQIEFLQELGIDEPALEKLTQNAYQMLGLISYFTVGKDEVRAWAVRNGSNAPKAARAIHEDIERGFIRAELMKYQDFIDYGNEQQIKNAGRFHLKGKNYIVEDGDVLSFRFNV